MLWMIGVCWQCAAAGLVMKSASGVSSFVCVDRRVGRCVAAVINCVGECSECVVAECADLCRDLIVLMVNLRVC